MTTQCRNDRLKSCQTLPSRNPRHFPDSGFEDLSCAGPPSGQKELPIVDNSQRRKGRSSLTREWAEVVELGGRGRTNQNSRETVLKSHPSLSQDAQKKVRVKA
ncbi:Hypothetical protein NTJ_11746 [Nesidiocoris tenuis]|nr:Hypothetical protein NTJ_11746 [Nesidiocoris tenuis]